MARAREAGDAEVPLTLRAASACRGLGPTRPKSNTLSLLVVRPSFTAPRLTASRNCDDLVAVALHRVRIPSRTRRTLVHARVQRPSIPEIHARRPSTPRNPRSASVAPHVHRRRLGDYDSPRSRYPRRSPRSTDDASSPPSSPLYPPPSTRRDAPLSISFSAMACS